MRRAVLALALGLACASFAVPQEPRERPANSREEESHDPWIWWKLVNFAILVAGLGYLVRKHAPPYYKRTALEIEQAILQATTAKKEAEARAAAIELRLAGLQNEIANLRTDSRDQMAAEGRRIASETEQRLERIKTQSVQEIALMARNAREELRKYAAQIALDLAEQRIRSRIGKDTQDALADAFLQDLHSHTASGVRN